MQNYRSLRSLVVPLTDLNIVTGANGSGKSILYRALRLLADGSRLDGQSPDLALHRAEIDQATGMLTVQLGVLIAEAFARLRAYAYSEDRRLADVASDIVARRLRLHPDPDPDRVPDGGGS